MPTVKRASLRAGEILGFVTVAVFQPASSKVVRLVSLFKKATLHRYRYVDISIWSVNSGNSLTKHRNSMDHKQTLTLTLYQSG